MTDRLPVPYSERKLPVLPPTDRRDETTLRALICYIGRLIHEAGYVDGLAGSISARLENSRILATPPGLAIGFLQPEQILSFDLDLDPATPSASGAARSDDLPMHLACYRERPDIGSVIHAHPATAIALTIAGVSMRTCVVPEAIVVLGLVPTAAYQVPSSPEGREAIRLLIGQHDALLLAYHGSLTVGADIWQAYLKLETLEHTATILHRVAQLGPIAPLPPGQVARLLEQRRQLGYWRPGDDERFCEMCGVC